jgi:hypothetical protein
MNEDIIKIKLLCTDRRDRDLNFGPNLKEAAKPMVYLAWKYPHLSSLHQKRSKNATAYSMHQGIKAQRYFIPVQRQFTTAEELSVRP